VTRYKVLERLTYKDGEDAVPVTYVEIYPETGRTHQIRTHFKSIRHPLLGDPLYGPGKNNKAGLLDAKRTMLHAAKITFKVANDKDVVVEAPLPEDFKGILAKLS
jgi:23S rRNA pseudouridine1911/1915/1917 synthase